MKPSGPRPSLLKVMVENAITMSVLYLGTAALLEALRRVHSNTFLEAITRDFERVPARVLDVVGLLAPLRNTYVYGGMSELALRGVFGVTMVATIFVMAVVVGSVLWAVLRLIERRG